MCYFRHPIITEGGRYVCSDRKRKRENCPSRFWRPLCQGWGSYWAFLPDERGHEIREALADTGIEVNDVLASGRLVLGEGKTQPEEMRGWYTEVIARAQGKYPLIRWGGDMTWSFEKMPKSETLMEWESMCSIIEDPPAIFFCQYDLTKFLGSVVVDAMKTHPFCIISKVIHQNPFYEKPEDFLERLRSQHAS